MKHPQFIHSTSLATHEDDLPFSEDVNTLRVSAGRLSRLGSSTVSPPSTARFLPFGSLWDPNLLDRLSEPLTRYHE